jgi:hypothetical protein
MAWISIHEDVIGPKLREFSKLSGLSRNEALGSLVVLWLWGIKNADQSGLVISADKRDISNIISAGLSGSADAFAVIECMIKSGWIDEEDGALYLHDWDEWQEFWYRYISRKEKDTARKRKSRETAGRKPAEAVSASSEIEPEPSAPKAKAKQAKVKYAEFVSMTEREYQRLVEDYGEPAVLKFIEILDNYKGSKGKTYKNDYRAILSWVIEKVRKEFPSLIKVQSSSEEESLFADWESEWSESDDGYC